MLAIDLNCDMGEGFGPYQIGPDEEVMPLISSANVACGFHAGDPQVIRRTVELAARLGVHVGAHVSFPDLVGFGRREMYLSAAEVENDLLYQLGAITAFCRIAGTALQHVKPHGALYNMAQGDPILATAVARSVAAFDSRLILFAQPGSAMTDAAANLGLRVAAEFFADRAYSSTGRLVSRSLKGGLLTDPDQVAERAVAMAVHGQVVAVDGSILPVRAQSICLHSDTPGAAGLIRRVREGLAAAGVQVRPPTC